MKMKIRSRDYEANALAIMELPFVKKLIEENKKLKSRNKALKNLIYSLPEFRHPANVPDSDVEIIEKPVQIKKEPIVYEIQEKDDSTIGSPNIVGDLTRCEYSLNSFTDIDAPTIDDDDTKIIYTDDYETVLLKNPKQNQKEEAPVYYQKYKCSKCGFITTNDDPDCAKCKKKSCMLAITDDAEEEEEEEEDEEEERYLFV